MFVTSCMKIVLLIKQTWRPFAQREKTMVIPLQHENCLYCYQGEIKTGQWYSWKLWNILKDRNFWNSKWILHKVVSILHSFQKLWLFRANIACSILILLSNQAQVPQQFKNYCEKSVRIFLMCCNVIHSMVCISVAMVVKNIFRLTCTCKYFF